MGHKLVRFIRIKNNSRNFKSRRERIGQRPSVYLTLITGVPVHMTHQTAALSLTQFLQVFAVLTQQRAWASNVFAYLGYSVNNWKIQKYMDKIECIPKKKKTNSLLPAPPDSYSWRWTGNPGWEVPEYVFPPWQRSISTKQRSSRRKKNNLPLWKSSLNFCISNCF